MKINSPLKRYYIALTLIVVNCFNTVFAVDFNTDVLDTADKENLDLARFSQPGYIMPGQYQLQVLVNGENIYSSDFQIDFIENSAAKKNPQTRVCLTKDIVNLIGLTTASREKITWWDSGRCADFSKLAGVTLQPTLSEGQLNITIPQAWLEYSDATWLPPSRWDQGIAGFLFDYNVNGIVNKPVKGQQSQNVSYNGTAGFNFDAWRLRGDYQGSMGHNAATKFDWSRFYLYRAIARWQSNLTLGQNYISSDIFNSWRYTGVSLESDDRMLPPKLRGYAPQVSGVADTNARVVISQQGRILYDSTVPAGPFVIRDLDSSVRGRLDVEIIEQNGQKKKFQIDTAYVPYLTRPGRVRYKVASGRAGIHNTASGGPLFTAGEISWGVNNNWSLYGGGIFSGDYNSVALGVGRDLNEFGTLSADVTQSVASLPNNTKRGKSWRLSYSKFFDEADADITFAGYRFSERSYMTMDKYLNARYNGDYSGREKEQYTISLNKQLASWDTSIGLQYNHQTYWDRNATESYTLSLNRYVDVGEIKNISLGLTVSRYLRANNVSGNKNSYDDSVFLRLSLPMGSASVNSSSSLSDKRFNQTVGYSDTLNDGLDSYSINAGVNAGGGERTQGVVNGFYSHGNSVSTLSANFAAVQNGYTSFGASASGGLTVTAKGAALHGGSANGGTRLLVDTDGVGGVPVDGGRTITNRWGIGVITNVSSYYRNTTSIDVNKLPDDVEAIKAVSESMLTEGAIGYRKFEVLKGTRLFAVLRLADNSYPPFGASVTDAKGRELGMVGDDGLVWLSGIKPGETVRVGWNGRKQCTAKIPGTLKSQQQLLLPCNNKN
ncbi:fimbria/pilus outer membrane usher protein [Vagococcus sp. WN89Y]|uniref:fimbria/pilus outer membrane usher protein n=1 Tax=Vagococcus sp. WN89Y TaxID=3457258 RepID=UPI003FCE10CF